MQLKLRLNKQELLYWVIGLLLITPATLPYFSHYRSATTDRQATGFCAYDMPIYIAHARERFDSGQFRLTYGNPCSLSYDTPRVYFQPSTLILALLWRFTDLEPGTILLVFGFVAALVCARIAIALLHEIITLNTATHWLVLLLFFWGGGVLVGTGIISSLVSTGKVAEIFQFDASRGVWCLNFGRTLFYPMEAFYHALFFACIIAVITKRFKLAILLALLCSMCHPFTGTELLAILLVWAFLEARFLKSGEVPLSFLYACVGLFILHVGYYIFFLNSFPEHHQLSIQWKQPWTYGAVNFIPAYALVGLLALWSIRRFDLAKRFFASVQHRLFLVWFLVAFALANHEFATAKPVQPLHFTRGYVWVALFLLGIGSLTGLLDFVAARMKRFWAVTCCVLVAAVFLFDNAVWLSPWRLDPSHSPAERFVYTTPDQREVLPWMNSEENRGYIVLSQDEQVGYLAIVYSPLRSWYSHPYNTPYNHAMKNQQKAFFQQGQYFELWDRMPLIIVFDLKQSVPKEVIARVQQALTNKGARKVFQNSSYAIFRKGAR